MSAPQAGDSGFSSRLGILSLFSQSPFAPVSVSWQGNELAHVHLTLPICSVLSHGRLAYRLRENRG